MLGYAIAFAIQQIPFIAIVARVERSGTQGTVTLATKSPAFRKLHAGYLLFIAQLRS
jgi:exosome complex RNA-binding protein Rrp4